MRTIGVTIVLAAGAILAIGVPTVGAQHCELVGCRTECQPVPGGRWCQRRCTRRCYHDPTPYYYPPSAPHAPTYSPPEFPVSIVVAAIAGILVVAFVVVASQSNEAARHEEEAAATDADTAQIIAETQVQASTISDIDTYIAAVETSAREAGRRAADDEWRRRHGRQ